MRPGGPTIALRDRTPAVDSYALAEAVRDFFHRHPQVNVWEDGRCVLHVGGDGAGFSLSADRTKLVCHFWSDAGSVVRRVTRVTGSGASKLAIEGWRMGQAQPTRMSLVAGGGDDDGKIRHAERRAIFRQAVIAAAEWNWLGWKYVTTTGGTAPARSGVQRFAFRRQNAIRACVAVAMEEAGATAEAALGQALSWAERIGNQAPGDYLAEVRVIVPPEAAESLRQRTSGLRQNPHIETLTLDRSSGRLEASDQPVEEPRGLLRRAPVGVPPTEEEAALLAEVRIYCPQAYWLSAPEGGGTISVYGLDVARTARGAEALMAPFTYGCGGERSALLASARPDFERMLAAVGAQRVPGGDMRHRLYAMLPERWMEHLFRQDLSLLSPDFDPRFVYAQVPDCGPGRRNVLDLLAIDRRGRLAVIELKADEQLDFPLQGLAYWQSVRAHQVAGDFERLGYFPGTVLRPEPPRLWLVAPALRWHPESDTICGWLAPEVPWIRVGINEEWRRGLQIIYQRHAGSAN